MKITPVSPEHFYLPVLLALLLQGCTTAVSVDPSSVTEKYVVIPVHYATDRNLNPDRPPASRYGAERSDLTYGTCDVSIPKIHALGHVERPSIWKLEFSENPARHILLRELTVQDRDAFFTGVRDRILSSAARNAFIFIHGYNVTFADAALRTAQMAFDLGFEGAPVFYSWPSQGSLPAYPVDESNVEWTQADLGIFLADFAARSDADSIFLIAHSMGNRALTRAFVSLLAEKPELKARFREVILAAPDIDAEVFKRDIAPKFVDAGVSLTLYASSQDKALVASRTFHGYPRAGDSGDRLVVMPGIETVDATHVDSEDWLLGHSYYGSRSILSDLFYLIKNGHRAKDRFSLKTVATPAGNYYEFR